MKLNFPILPFVTAMLSSSLVFASQSLVEIRLIDDIDEARGYCLDIAGGQGQNAPVERGLQAHTCYNYTGSILEDQGFDATQVPQDQFRIVYFDVCMSASAKEAGASLQLLACDASELQQFDLTQEGQLSLTAEPTLCVTVDSASKREGRGGEPKHVMRPVTLQACAEQNAAYQQWTLLSID